MQIIFFGFLQCRVVYPLRIQVSNKLPLWHAIVYGLRHLHFAFSINHCQHLANVLHVSYVIKGLWPLSEGGD